MYLDGLMRICSSVFQYRIASRSLDDHSFSGWPRRGDSHTRAPAAQHLRHSGARWSAGRSRGARMNDGSGEIGPSPYRPVASTGEWFAFRQL